MHLNDKQKKRANNFYNALKNFMSLKPDEYYKSKVEICKECNGTGLIGVFGNKDNGVMHGMELIIVINVMVLVL